MIEERIKAAIRDVNDFPKKGIVFKDITPILLDHQLCNDIADEFVQRLNGYKIDALVGVESRGFLFGLLISHRLKIPFIPVRKLGKLPYKTISYEYELEYGKGHVEMHIDTIQHGWNVLIHDDLLATGGTACAASELVKMQGGNIAGFAFIVTLDFLNGKDMLSSYSDNILQLVNY